MGSCFSSDRRHKQHGPSSSSNQYTPNQRGNIASPKGQHACHLPRVHSTKKALLIGIRYKEGRPPASCSKTSMDLGEVTHREVRTWHDILIQYCGYRADEIICMQDIHENKGGDRWPDKKNILAQLEDLVRDVRPDDRRFLFIAGHGSQLPTTSDQTELDGQDEIMYTLEKDKKTCQIIKDNDLRLILVDKLPSDANLTAVLELCSSGTLMDLPFRLNISEAGLPTLAPAKRHAENVNGNILCLSACEDWQKAHHFKHSQTTEEGILTSMIQANLAARSREKGELPVVKLYRGLIETCQELCKDGSGLTVQTPVVTVGRRMVQSELDALVFRP